MDMRDAFFDTVCARALADASVVVLTCDQGALPLEGLRVDRPDQWINMGIAEQCLIDVAAGMAMEGMRPIVYGITPFVSQRCFEQICVDLGTTGLPVVIAASGAGLTYASDGPTHHAMHDLGALRTIPIMAIYNPADPVCMGACVAAAMDTTSPVYVRIEKGVYPALHRADLELASRGMGMLREGRDVMLVATGIMVHRALEVATELAEQGITASVMDVFRLDRLTEETMAVITDSGRVVIVEENTPVGGLRSLVLESCSIAGIHADCLSLCLPAEPCFAYGDRDWLHRRASLDVESIGRRIRAWLP